MEDDAIACDDRDLVFPLGDYQTLRCCLDRPDWTIQFAPLISCVDAATKVFRNPNRYVKPLLPPWVSRMPFESHLLCCFTVLTR